MNGPIIVAKPLCWWSQMGPYLVLKNTVYGHEWACYISWEILPIPCVGPFLVLKITANGHEWAHCDFHQLPCMSPFWWIKILPMAMNGPTVSSERCCQYTCEPIPDAEKYYWYTCVGPPCLVRDTTNSLVWAHSYGLKYCQWQWMGPLLLLRNAADTLVSAHHNLWEILLTPLYGPILVDKNTANGNEWAHHFSWEMLPIHLCGPILGAENYCQWSWMGPLCLLPTPLYGPILMDENTANGNEWAHHFSWEMLLIHLCGPILDAEKYYQYTCVGPPWLLRDTTNSFVWAHCIHMSTLTQWAHMGNAKAHDTFAPGFYQALHMFFATWVQNKRCMKCNLCT